MIRVSVLVALLLSPSRAEPRATTKRYKPLIQVTEEIDINDITFTTSAPDFHNGAAYYNGKGTHPRLPDTSPGPHPRGEKLHKDGYGVPSEKIYAAGQPFAPAGVKYKPYKVFKVQEGLRPLAPYKPRPHEKTKPSFDPPTTYGAPEPPKFAAKLVPFSSQFSPKAPTRASSFHTQDNKNFIPSPTFSPTVLAQINGENTPKFPEPSDIHPFAVQRAVDRPRPSKRPHHAKSPVRVPDNHRSPSLPDVFPTPETDPVTPVHPQSPQQSESLLSEISTLHKGNNLDDVADSLDLKTGERVEFQMYGMDGPKSYKFGFDTGKGHNRHFRFEERDNTGKVKGHYGYLDEDGKMRIMKYEADPVTGFHAGPVEISPDDN